MSTSTAPEQDSPGTEDIEITDQASKSPEQKQLDRQLHRQIYQLDIDRLNYWLEGIGKTLEEGADVNAVLNGNAPLHWAIARENSDIITLLNGNTPLHLAIERENVDIIALLLEKKGSDIDINKENKYGNTLITQAIKSMEILELLLEKFGDELDVNRRNSMGKTVIQKSHDVCSRVDFLNATDKIRMRECFTYLMEVKASEIDPNLLFEEPYILTGLSSPMKFLHILHTGSDEHPNGGLYSALEACLKNNDRNIFMNYYHFRMNLIMSMQRNPLESQDIGVYVEMLDDDDNGSSRGCPEVNVLTGKKEFSLYQDQIIQSTISFLKICLTSHMYNVYIYLLYMYASIGLDDQEEEDWVMV